MRETERSRWVEDGQELDSGYSTFETLIRYPVGDVKWGAGVQRSHPGWRELSMGFISINAI